MRASSFNLLRLFCNMILDSRSKDRQSHLYVKRARPAISPQLTPANWANFGRCEILR